MDIKENLLIAVIAIFLMFVLSGCIKTNYIELEETVLPDYAECDLYGTWYIAKVALVSDMYTGTTLDGDFEENLFDPAEYIGYELQYSEDFFCLGDAKYCDPLYEMKYQSVEDYDDGGKFKVPDIYEFIEEEGIKVEGEEKYRYLSDVLLKRYEISFRKPVKYGKFEFIPVGTQCILLNRDTMLVGVWGKILLAYRKY